MLFRRQPSQAKRGVGFLLCAVGVFLVFQSAQAQPQFSLVETEGVFSIVANGRVLFRVRHRGNYASCEERAKTILRNLQTAFSSSFKSPPTFRLAREGGGKVSALCGDKKLFTVSREDAALNASNTLDLALLWLNEIQMVFFGIHSGTYRVEKELQGLASWCSSKFEGQRTSAGETYSSYAFTAAHRTLPFGSILLITNLRNGRRVVVKVNSRGPRKKSRIVDLSRAAAKVLGIEKKGVEEVRIEVIRWGGK
ncbi:MAG: septal ring lytic transglycosylase RlpA family protein [Candidatus Caldatribacteriaceae bacterium]